MRRRGDDGQDDYAGTDWRGLCRHVAFWAIAMVMTLCRAAEGDAEGAPATDQDGRRDEEVHVSKRHVRVRRCRAAAKKGGTPWARGARWALEGRWRAGRRRGVRRGRLRGSFRAKHLGIGASCGAAWRPWKKEGDVARGSDPLAKAWMAELATEWRPTLLRAPGEREDVVYNARVSIGPSCPAAGTDEGPRAGARSRRAAGTIGGRHARAATALAATLLLAAARTGDATGTEAPAGGGATAGAHFEVDAGWRQSLVYPEPHRDGFRDFATPGHADAVAGPGRRQHEEEFALAVETVNSTGWGPMQRRLMGTTAHVVLGQETWVLPSLLAQASSWCRRNGWESIFAPAVTGPGGGASGGVAIFARGGLGLRHPHVGSHILEEGRAVVGFVEPPGHRPILAASIYLRDGKGVKEANKATLAAVGRCAEAHGPDCLVLCGGDYQCGPDSVESSGFPRQVRGRILAASTARGTYRTRAVASTLDFFVASSELALAVDSVGLVEGTGVKGHVPVRVVFVPRPVALKGLAIRSPPKLGLDRVYGPVPPPRDWRKTKRLTDAAHTAAVNGSSEVEVQRCIDSAYEAWAQVAEEEIADATGSTPAKWGLRGRVPKLRWASVLPERAATGAPSAAALATWMRGYANEMGRVADLLAAEVGAGIFIDPAPAGTNRPHGATFATPVRGGYGGDAALADGRRGAGGRPRPATDLRACEEIVEEIGGELRSNMGGKAGDGERGCDMDKLIVLADRVLAAVRNTRRAGAHDDLRLGDDIADIVRELTARERHTETERDAQSRKQWKAWLESDWNEGARHAHAATRMPVEWRPTVVDVGGGEVSASPLELLDDMRRRYVKYWDATSEPFEYRWGARCRPLERLTPGQLRAASMAFSKRTTMTYDGFHVRHFAMISDEGLSALGVLLEVVEVTSRWPSQLGVVTTPMLPKPKGGHRLIGKLTGLYRLWAKARRCHAEAWEAANDRPYLAASSGSGPVDAVFRQAMRQEASAASGEVALTVLEDMEAFYETICRDGLASEASILGFPTCILRACIATYAAPRMVAMGQYVAKETFARRGIIAGCGFATTLTRVSYIRKFDRLVKDIPEDTKLDVYIDDVALTTHGPRKRAIASAIRAHECLRRALAGSTGFKLAPLKASIVASDRAAGKIVAAAVGREGAESECATNLGVDVTAGGRRRRIGRGSKRQARARVGTARGKRLWKVSQTIGRKALRIFTTGIAPAMCHGSQVWGLADREVHRLRQVAAQALRPKSRCRSLTAAHLVGGMPTATWETAVAVEYARAVWRASTRREYAAERGASLSDIRAQWETAHSKIKDTVDGYARDIARGGGRASAAVARRAWAEVRGPVGATALTLARLGWRMKNAFILIDAQGGEVALTTTAPALVRHFLREATMDAAERFVANRWAKDDTEFDGRRVCADVAVRQIATACGGKLNGMQVGAYRAAVCGGIYTRHRAAADGYAVEDVCPQCGAEGDTVHHRVYCCPHTRAAVLDQVPRWLYEEGGRARPTDRFWNTSLFPHPADVWPQPARDFSGYTVGDEEGSNGSLHWWDAVDGFGDDIYTDGSCEHSPIRGLARAAAAAVQVDGDGRRIRAIFLPVPRHLPQTSQAGEYVAVGTARRMAAKKARIRCDCENVVRTANAAVRSALAPGKLYAGIALDSFTRVGDEAVEGTTVEWVKAHRKEHEDMSHATLVDVRGNAAADALAGEAVLMHPQPTHDQRVQLDYYLKRAPLVARAIGTALAMFPAAEAHRLRRRAAPATAEDADAAGQHVWQFAQGLWRCDKCGTWAHGDELRPKHHADKCPGHVAHRKAAAWTTKGHKIAMVKGVAPFAFCVRCGAWGNRRPRKLEKPCQGPTPAGTMALARIAKGKHPWRRRLSGGGEGARTNITIVAAFDRVERSWRASGRSGRVTKRSVVAKSRAASAGSGADQPDRETSHSSGAARGELGGAATGPAVAVAAAVAADMMNLAADDLLDEDPFGHGGDLDQDAGSGGCRGAVVNRAADERALGAPSSRAGHGAGDAPTKRDWPVVCEDAGSDSACNRDLGMRSAAFRLEEVRRRVRRRIGSGGGGGAACMAATPGEVEARRDGDTGEVEDNSTGAAPMIGGERGERSARAIGASNNSTNGARVGLGGSREVRATVAAALDLRDRVAATVATERGAAHLCPQVLAASPPSGSAAPLDGRETGARDRRPGCTTLQVRPERLGAGPSSKRPEGKPGNGDGLPAGVSEEAGGTELPHLSALAAWGGASAARLEVGEEPQRGSTQSTRDARSECAIHLEDGEGHGVRVTTRHQDRDSVNAAEATAVMSVDAGAGEASQVAVGGGTDRPLGVAKIAERGRDKGGGGGAGGSAAEEREAKRRRGSGYSVSESGGLEDAWCSELAPASLGHGVRTDGGSGARGFGVARSTTIGGGADSLVGLSAGASALMQPEDVDFEPAPLKRVVTDLSHSPFGCLTDDAVSISFCGRSYADATAGAVEAVGGRRGTVGASTLHDGSGRHGDCSIPSPSHLRVRTAVGVDGHREASLEADGAEDACVSRSRAGNSETHHPLHHPLIASLSMGLQCHSSSRTSPTRRPVRDEHREARHHDSLGRGSRCSPHPAEARPPATTKDWSSGEVACLDGDSPPGVPAVLHSVQALPLHGQRFQYVQSAMGIDEVGSRGRREGARSDGGRNGGGDGDGDRFRGGRPRASPGWHAEGGEGRLRHVRMGAACPPANRRDLIDELRRGAARPARGGEPGHAHDGHDGRADDADARGGRTGGHHAGRQDARPDARDGPVPTHLAGIANHGHDGAAADADADARGGRMEGPRAVRQDARPDARDEPAPTPLVGISRREDLLRMLRGPPGQPPCRARPACGEEHARARGAPQHRGNEGAADGAGGADAEHDHVQRRDDGLRGEHGGDADVEGRHANGRRGLSPTSAIGQGTRANGARRSAHGDRAKRNRDCHLPAERGDRGHLREDVSPPCYRRDEVPHDGDHAWRVGHYRDSRWRQGGDDAVDDPSGAAQGKEGPRLSGHAPRECDRAAADGERADAGVHVVVSLGIGLGLRAGDARVSGRGDRHSAVRDRDPPPVREGRGLVQRAGHDDPVRAPRGPLQRTRDDPRGDVRSLEVNGKDGSDTRSQPSLGHVPSTECQRRGVAAADGADLQRRAENVTARAQPSDGAVEHTGRSGGEFVPCIAEQRRGTPPREGRAARASEGSADRQSPSHQYGKHGSRGSSSVRSRAPGTVLSDEGVSR